MLHATLKSLLARKLRLGLTALSIVPDLVVPATTATRLALMLTHLAAAAIVIPTVARALPTRGR